MLLPPENDVDDRLRVWEAMEIFWLDSDVDIRFELSAMICAQSKYTLVDLRDIFFNEVRPALKFNLSAPQPEWAGFDRDWLAQRVLEKTKFRRRYSLQRVPESLRNHWKRLGKTIRLYRDAGVGQ